MRRPTTVWVVTASPRAGLGIQHIVKDNHNRFNGRVAEDMTIANQATSAVFLTDSRYAKLARLYRACSRALPASW